MPNRKSKKVAEPASNQTRNADVPTRTNIPDNLELTLKPPPDLLTERELQIIQLVAEGKINKQVADHLKISEWTVSTHLRRIFAKLRVRSRAEMVYKCANIIDRLQKTAP
jgi:DNA-binding CsgD family transcriptional regulator